MISFNTVARNWLALHGNFNQFDYTLFTNSGIPKEQYENFCYYSAGFKPSKNKTPKEVFEAACEKKKSSLLPFNSSFDKNTANSVLSLLTSWFLNPDNKLLSVRLTFGDVIAQTLFQYVWLQHHGHVSVTAEDLMDLNIVSYSCEKRTTQAYLVGTQVISSLSEDEFNRVLKLAYDRVLAVCNSDKLMNNIGEFAVLCMNETTGVAKKSVLAEFKNALILAGAIDTTLNKIMHSFGYNIPDVAYSIDSFGSVAMINEYNKYVSVTAEGTLLEHDIGKLPSVTSEIEINLNADDFVNGLCSKGAVTPRRIKID